MKIMLKSEYLQHSYLYEEKTVQTTEIMGKFSAGDELTTTL